MSGVVYVAEDDPHMRAWLLASLVRAGHRAEVFESAFHLLERVRGSLDVDLPALIVSDFRMRGWTGLEAFVMLRAWGCPAPLVLITAFPDPALLDEAACHGVNEAVRVEGVLGDDPALPGPKDRRCGAALPRVWRRVRGCGVAVQRLILLLDTEQV